MRFTKIVREKFITGINKNNLVSPGDKILVALSGGPDSVCLYHLLTTLGKKFSIDTGAVYIDHGLRPGEVKKEITLVKKLASDLHTPIHIARLKIIKTKSGPEAAARRLRYLAIKSVALENSYSKIATAHNLNDQAETTLLNILRSTGDEGLFGIPAVREIKDENTKKKIIIIRPLLGILRSEIYGYIRENHLAYRTDTSNYDTRFSRNLLRIKIIPTMEKINPGVNLHLSNLAEWAEEARKCLDVQTAGILSKISKKLKNGIYLDLSRFLGYNYNSKVRIIRNILRGFYTVPSIAQIQSIIKLASKRGKPEKALNLENHLTINLKRSHIIFRRKNDRHKTI